MQSSIKMQRTNGRKTNYKQKQSRRKWTQKPVVNVPVILPLIKSCDLCQKMQLRCSGCKIGYCLCNDDDYQVEIDLDDSTDIRCFREAVCKSCIPRLEHYRPVTCTGQDTPCELCEKIVCKNHNSETTESGLIICCKCFLFHI